MFLLSPFDVHKCKKTKQIEVASDLLTIKDSPISKVDTSWLKSASDVYDISPDIDDYIITTALTFPISIPNRNNFGFSLSNICEFSGLYGRPYYKTWIGQPAFHEHQNKDYTKANGVILDTCIHKDPRGFYKLLSLVAHDRTKYENLIKRVSSGELNSYSMGAYVEGGYVCSITGGDLASSPYQLGKGKQRGMVPNVVVIDGVKRLAFRVGLNPKGFEISLVEQPAWAIATLEKVGDKEYI